MLLLHVPQIDTTTRKISCMKDGCHWSFPAPGPGAQESFESHLIGRFAEHPDNPNYERKLVTWDEK